jgi:nucleoside-diphosphate-sugar epimerase
MSSATSLKPNKPSPDRRVVIVGSQSRAGRAIAGRFLPEEVIRIGRRPSLPTEKEVSSYLDATPSLIPKGSIIVNCVGISDGARETLELVNVGVPIAWAAAARAAGARQMIQLSSFAVYGEAEHIRASTPEYPSGIYGESKLKADRQLLSLADSDFVVAVLRVPMLYGLDGTDKLGRLIRTLGAIHLVPQPTLLIERSMLSYQLLSEVVGEIIATGAGGTMHAAEPTPFRWPMVAEAMRRNRRFLVQMPLPRGGLAMLRLAAPKLNSRLFRSSLVDPGLNISKQAGESIEDVISTILQTSAR